MEFRSFLGTKWLEGRGICHDIVPPSKHPCNGLLPGTGILSAGRTIEVNLKSIKCTTVNKSSTGDDESVSHLRKRAQPRWTAQETGRVDSRYLSALDGSPKCAINPFDFMFDVFLLLWCRSHGWSRTTMRRARKLIQIVGKHRRDQTLYWSLLFRMSLKTWKFLLYEILLLTHTCDDRIFRNHHRYRFRTVL